jgi:hypothetical protein
VGAKLSDAQESEALKWFNEHCLAKYEAMGRVVRVAVLDELDADGNWQYDVLVRMSGSAPPQEEP